MVGFHEPVLLQETLTYINVRRNKKYIDATVGGGGHAVEIVEQGGKVLGIDVDPDAVEEAREKLEDRGRKTDLEERGWKIEKENFKNIEKIAKENDFYPVAGILYDLGMSSYQLEQSGRGFSFQRDEPLDMRADPNLKVTASDLVNGLTEPELTKLFEKYGEESRARAVAGAIVRSRWDKTIRTSRELADIVSRSTDKRGFGGRLARRKLHPATKVFQALRIAVNDELNNLQSSLPQAFGLLETGGRLVVISFHSLEDRVVKKFFKKMEEESLAKIVTHKCVTPSEEEVERNPRARSAKLRVVEKIRNPKFEVPNKF
jgi:16S rRNA (cytosine1402-N4)-methyltransferase